MFVADLFMVRRVNVNSTNRKFIGFFITLSKWQIKIQRKGYENLDTIKKAAVVKKLEKETLDITTDDSLLEKKKVHEGMIFKIYCMEKLTIFAKYTGNV